MTGALRPRSGRQGRGDRRSPLWRRRSGRNWRQDRQWLARHGCGDLCPPRIRIRFGGSESGGRVEIADAVQDDAAVEIGGCETRIILNRQIVRDEPWHRFETADRSGVCLFRCGRNRQCHGGLDGRCVSSFEAVMSGCSAATTCASPTILSGAISAAPGGFENIPNRTYPPTSTAEMTVAAIVLEATLPITS